jgi:hypothetical protein
MQILCYSSSEVNLQWSGVCLKLEVALSYHSTKKRTSQGSTLRRNVNSRSSGLLESITSWEASSEPSLSDHRHILFTLRGSVPVCLIRKCRGTNWDFFWEGLRGRLERGPEMNVKDEAELGLAVHWVQQALISAYEDNCPLRPVVCCGWFVWHKLYGVWCHLLTSWYWNYAVFKGIQTQKFAFPSKKPLASSSIKCE